MLHARTDIKPINNSGFFNFLPLYGREAIDPLVLEYYKLVEFKSSKPRIMSRSLKQIISDIYAGYLVSHGKTSGYCQAKAYFFPDLKQVLLRGVQEQRFLLQHIKPKGSINASINTRAISIVSIHFSI